MGKQNVQAKEVYYNDKNNGHDSNDDDNLSIIILIFMVYPAVKRISASEPPVVFIGKFYDGFLRMKTTWRSR